MKVEVVIPKTLLDDIKSVYKDISEPTLVAVATQVQHELMNQKPSPPRRGSMQFASEKQRRFVMASINNGDITVPYKRGISKQSQRMNRSFKIVRTPRDVMITNTATYWTYVIGSKQAQIHKGRWKTVDMAVTNVLKSGLVEDVVNDIIKKKFGGR